MPSVLFIATVLSAGRVHLLDAVLLAATTKKASAGSSILLFVVILAGGGYFLLIRPQRARARRAQVATKGIEVGDKVMLSSGIIGRVVDFVGDNARVEIAPGTVIEVLRRAVVQKVDELSDDDIAVRPLDDDEDAADHDEHDDQDEHDEHDEDDEDGDEPEADDADEADEAEGHDEDGGHEVAGDPYSVAPSEPSDQSKAGGADAAP